MPSSGKLRRVALVRIEVSEERIASIIRVTRIGELEITLAVTSNRSTLLRTFLSSVLTGVTRRDIPEDRRENLIFYPLILVVIQTLMCLGWWSNVSWRQKCNATASLNAGISVSRQQSFADAMLRMAVSSTHFRCVSVATHEGVFNVHNKGPPTCDNPNVIWNVWGHFQRQGFGLKSWAAPSWVPVCYLAVRLMNDVVILLKLFCRYCLTLCPAVKGRVLRFQRDGAPASALCGRYSAALELGTYRNVDWNS
jgi:hypothetical protein